MWSEGGHWRAAAASKEAFRAAQPYYRRGMPDKSDRPTIPPSFDVEQYAKDSDARVARGRAPEPDEAPQSGQAKKQSEMRLATRREMSAATADEAWAQSMEGSPLCVMTAEALKQLPLDHRAGFLLSLMDGSTDLDVVVEIAGMARSEVLRIVRELFEAGVIQFG
jgi:hypothetical protein